MKPMSIEEARELAMLTDLITASLEKIGDNRNSL